MKNPNRHAIVLILLSITLIGCEPVSVSNLTDTDAASKNPDTATEALDAKIDSLTAQVNTFKKELETRNQEIEIQKLANEKLQATLNQSTAKNKKTNPTSHISFSKHPGDSGDVHILSGSIESTRNISIKHSWQNGTRIRKEHFRGTQKDGNAAL